MDFGTFFEKNKDLFYTNGAIDWEGFKERAAMQLFSLHLLGVTCRNGIIKFRFSCNDVMEYVITVTSDDKCWLG